MKKAMILWNALLFSCLVGFFLLMRLFGLHEILELRYLNLVFNFGVVFLAMRHYRAHTDEPFSFWNTAMTGAKAVIPAILAFAVFQFMYLRFMDPGFMAYVKANAPMGEYLNPTIIGCALIAEGLLGTFFSAYVGMRWLAAREHAKFPAL